MARKSNVDGFSETVRRKLCKDVGGKCSKCRAPTEGGGVVLLVMQRILPPPLLVVYVMMITMSSAILTKMVFGFVLNVILWSIIGLLNIYIPLSF